MDLIAGEQINLDNLLPEIQQVMTDEDINNKYIKGEVRIVTEQARYPLSSIKVMLSGTDYSLNPEFQRRHRWSTAQKSRLIESFIMNVPIPPIFLYEDSYSHYEVMDGLQRLTAIYEFYSDKYALESLEQWPELNGKTYSTLPLQIVRGIDRRYLSSIILLQETAKNEMEANQLKQLVFERINSGGVQLKPQESRNAIYGGKFNDLCIKLSRNEFLCKTWNIPVPTEEELQNNKISEELLANKAFSEMEDVEMVLRFFANRQREQLFKGSPNFRTFLDLYLMAANQFDQQTRDKLASLFEESITFVYELFGEKAFWLYRNRSENWNWLRRPTTAVYDSLMNVVPNYIDKKADILAKKHDFEDKAKSFYQQHYDIFEGRNVSPSIIKDRELKFTEFFDSLL